MKINPETLRYLESDVSQLKHDIEGIEESMKSLEARRDAAKFKLSLFQEQLKKHKPPNQASSANTGRTNSKSSLMIGSLEGLGMRDAMRRVLVQAPRALKTGDIADAMLSAGFHYTGSTDIKSRISNELSRMAQRGHVRKAKRHGKLFFSLPN